MDILPDNVILDECRKLITAFKEQLTIINGEFLSHHVIGIIQQGLVRYRDPDRNWYYKNFCAVLDNETKKVINKGKDDGNYYVISTDFHDNYLHDLLYSLRIETEEHYNAEIDNDRIKELEKQWRDTITEKYQYDEHLRRFVWDLKPFTYSHKYGHLRGQLIDITNEIIPNNVDFYSFVYCGLSFECLDYNHPYGIHVALKNAVGLFGNYVHYGRDTVILKDQEIIEIPATTYAPGLRHCTVVEIRKGVFESLHNTEIIKIPQTITKMDWSFWNCRNLKAIEVDEHNKYYCSIDGVLFSRDHKTLYAYPNNRGRIYDVPEGVEIIEKFAFKDCDEIEILMLPSSIKRIKLNAFYRATNLKKIVCACKKDGFINEGFYGDFGNVRPQWFYLQ